MSEHYVINSWGVAEFMGRVRLGGFCSTVLVGGVAMLRVQVPAGRHTAAFECVRGLTSLYAFTPTTETLARLVVEDEGRGSITLNGCNGYHPQRRVCVAGAANDEEEDDEEERYAVCEECAAASDEEEPPF